MSFMNIDEMAENEASCDSLIYEYPLLTELIETCSNVDNSPMMKAFVYILLHTYKKTDKEFRESQEFERALRRAITLIKNDSCHKFSYIGDLCDILTSGNIKEANTSNNSKDNEITETGRSSKKAVTEVVDLDSTENDFIIDLDSKDCNMMDEKENDTFNDNNSTDENNLLVPYRIMEVRERSPIDDDIDNNIKKLEQKIEKCKKIIAQLEEKEISDDDMNSPYIQSEKYKARIVKLYDELCKLTGAEAVKRSTVHLKVPEGYPSGPVRRLEALINKNASSDGHPTFPDFRDVVKCVIKANEEDDLGWSKQKIANEAMVLFTHCGRALQQRRQRREWRSLEWRRLISREKGERDPADSDPALLARLEQNRRAGARKEAELLERFAMMQNAPSQKAVVSNQEAKLNASESSNESEIEYMSTSSDDETNVNLPSQIATSSSSSQDNSEITAVKVKKEYNYDLGQLLEELGDNFTPSTSSININDSNNIIIEISDSSDDDSV